MRLLPEKLNNHLTAVCLIAGSYAGFRWFQGGGYVWKFIVGVCGYLAASGFWQAWVTRKK